MDGIDLMDRMDGTNLNRVTRLRIALRCACFGSLAVLAGFVLFDEVLGLFGKEAPLDADGFWGSFAFFLVFVAFWCLPATAIALRKTDPTIAKIAGLAFLGFILLGMVFPMIKTSL